jgi:hypothetical protein
MKANLLTSVLFSALLVFSACGKDDDDAKPADPTNPPVTTETAAMKAKVDNVAWESNTHSVANSSGMYTITGFGKNGENIVINSFDINKVGRYTAGSISFQKNGSGGDFQQWTAYLSDSTNVFTVTKYDAVNKKMSGNFSFKTTAYQGSVADTTHKTVTDGTFTDLGLPN